MTHGPPRPLRRQRIGVLLSVGVLGLAACSSTSVADPPTTETTVEDVEAAVREVHTRFMTELFVRDERVDGPEVMLQLAEEITTGRQLQRIQDRAARNAESGERDASPGYESSVLSVEIEDATAIVVDCSRDRGENYAADGALLDGADDFFKLRETWLVFQAEEWLVENFLTGGNSRCTPLDDV